MIREFARKVKKIYVLEEMDPFFEEQIKALGISVIGKEIFPYTGEFDPGIVQTAISGTKPNPSLAPSTFLPGRPTSVPVVPTADSSTSEPPETFVTGDIGCYTLSFMKPLEGLAFLHLHGRQHRHGPRNEQGPGREGKGERSSA